MKRSSSFILKSLGDRNILLPCGSSAIDCNRLVSLNSSAAFLWEAVGEDDFTESTLASLLESEYDIDHDFALAEAVRVASLWDEAGVLEK